ncbi:MAG: hypothetical protein MK171_08580 [Pirellulales bacterium]|nr:hypothetical protein [Pirellulales bacterium]
MNSRSAVLFLLVLVLGIPLLQAVLTWVISLLAAMGDEPAGNVLTFVNTGFRVTWLVCIVGLVVALALRSVDESKGE